MPKPELHSFVRQFVPPGRAKDRYAYGIIVALETYTDGNGTREWIYVRWINGDGKPDSEPLKHSIDELVPYTTATPTPLGFK